MVERGNRGSVGVIDNVENDIVLQRVVLCVHVHSLLAWCVSVCVSVCVCVCVQDERGAREQSPSMDIDVQEEEAEGKLCVRYCDICTNISTVFGIT